RRHAVRLCEGRFGQAPELGTALVKLTADPDAQVRLQLGCTLGEWDDARAGQALGQLLLKESGDRYFLTALLSSVNRKNLDAVLLAVLSGSKDGAPPAQLVERLLGLASAFGHSRATVTLLKAVATPEQGKHAAWQVAALAALLDDLDQRGAALA